MRRLALAVTSLLLGSAAAGMLTARAGSEQQVPLPHDFVKLVPPYPGAHYLPAGDDLHVDGAARLMAYAETDDTPARVLARYADTFAARGLAVRHYPSALVAASPDDDWRRTILVTSRERGSLIVASVSQTKPNRSRAHVPVPATCTVSESTGSHDAGVVRENIQLVCEGFTREITSFYDALMGDPARTMTSDDDTTWVATYERPGEYMTLVTSQLPRGDTPMASALIHWEAR